MKAFVALSVLLAVANAGFVPPMPLAKLEVSPQLEFEGRITSGEQAKPKQFPYQVGLEMKIGEQGGFCGGTIISDRWVMTAAHCLDIADSVTVVFGATNIRQKNDPNVQSIFVGKSGLYVHENWDPSTASNDIALIKLPVALQWNDYIQPAALPKAQNGRYSTYEGEIVVASGWGKDSDKANSITENLLFIEVPVMAQSTCGRYWPGGLVTPNHICISTKGGKSTCNGDSGGPLVHRENGVNYVIGATSFGMSLGCELGYPGVFTRVSAYADWIAKVSGVKA